MNLNGVTSAYAAYNSSAYAQKSETKVETSNNTAVEEGATYESTINKETDRSAIVAALKADAEARVNSFKQMVQDMLYKQGNKSVNADNIWKTLASGNFTVDAETAAKAKEEISEDGYWGVKQTSQRIFDMAVALSGGDEDKMEDMLDAFEKAFGEATKAWGSDLPDISQKTREAVLEKFENYKNGNKEETTV